MWDNVLTRGLLDGWQLSGDTGLVSGDWNGATTSTTDNFDFTGGDGGTRPRIEGDPSDAACQSGDCDPTPGGSGSYFNIPAFSRLTGRGDIGNAPVTVLPDAEDRPVEHVDLQELPARRRRAACNSGGRPTTSSTRSTGPPSTPTRSSIRPACRSTSRSARRRLPVTRASCRARFGLHSDSCLSPVGRLSGRAVVRLSGQPGNRATGFRDDRCLLPSNQELDSNDAITSCRRSDRRRVRDDARAPRPTRTSSCTRAIAGRAAASTSSGWLAITSIGGRSRCPPWPESWRSTTASSAASSSRPIPPTGISSPAAPTSRAWKRSKPPISSWCS